MSQHTAAQLPLKPLRALAAFTLPWLCSTSVHAVLLLVLALSYSWTLDRGPERGASLLVSFEGTSNSSEGAAVEGVELNGPAGGYYDDEVEMLARQGPEPHQGGGNAPALADLLNERPPAGLAGVLPAEGTTAGSGGGEGNDVGSAKGLTTQPKGSNRPQGGYARTGVFGAVGEGHKFVYVFDRSGSMDGHGGSPLAAAKSELLASLALLEQTHQFQIIFYNDKPRVFNPSGVAGRLVFGTEQNKYLAQRFVGSITADGATRHEEALEMALRMQPDVIFFLTDADQPQLSAKQLAQLAEMNHGTSINSIEFGYGVQTDSENFLVKLARQNGGKHVYVDISQLPSAR